MATKEQRAKAREIWAQNPDMGTDGLERLVAQETGLDESEVLGILHRFEIEKNKGLGLPDVSGRGLAAKKFASPTQAQEVKDAYHKIQDSRGMPIEDADEMAQMISTRTGIAVGLVKNLLLQMNIFAAQAWNAATKASRCTMLAAAGITNCPELEDFKYEDLPPTAVRMLGAKFDAKQEIENAGYEVGEAGSGANATVWARKKGPPLSGGTVQHAKSWDELKQRLQLSAKFSGLDEEGADEELADLWSSLSDIERKKAMEEAGLPHGPLTSWRGLNRQEKKKLANVLDPGGNYKAKFFGTGEKIDARDWARLSPEERVELLREKGTYDFKKVAQLGWDQLPENTRKALEHGYAREAGFSAKFSTNDVKTLWKKASKAQRRQALNKAKLSHKYALAALDAALAVPNLEGDEGDRVCAALQELSGEKLSAKFNSELIADGWNTTGKAGRKEILKKAGFSEIEIQSFWDHSWNEFHPILQQRIAAAIGLKMQASIKFDAASHWDEMSLDQKQGDAEALGWDASQAEQTWEQLTPEQQAAYESHYESEQGQMSAAFASTNRESGYEIGVALKKAGKSLQEALDSVQQAPNREELQGGIAQAYADGGPAAFAGEAKTWNKMTPEQQKELHPDAVGYDWETLPRDVRKQITEKMAHVHMNVEAGLATAKGLKANAKNDVLDAIREKLAYLSLERACAAVADELGLSEKQVCSIAEDAGFELTYAAKGLKAGAQATWDSLTRDARLSLLDRVAGLDTDKPAVARYGDDKWDALPENIREKLEEAARTQQYSGRAIVAAKFPSTAKYFSTLTKEQLAAKFKSEDQLIEERWDNMPGEKAKQLLLTNGYSEQEANSLAQETWRDLPDEVQRDLWKDFDTGRFAAKFTSRQDVINALRDYDTRSAAEAWSGMNDDFVDDVRDHLVRKGIDAYEGDVDDMIEEIAEQIMRPEWGRSGGRRGGFRALLPDKSIEYFADAESAAKFLADKGYTQRPDKVAHRVTATGKWSGVGVRVEKYEGRMPAKKFGGGNAARAASMAKEMLEGGVFADEIIPRIAKTLHSTPKAIADEIALADGSLARELGVHRFAGRPDWDAADPTARKAMLKKAGFGGIKGLEKRNWDQLPEEMRTGLETGSQMAAKFSALGAVWDSLGRAERADLFNKAGLPLDNTVLATVEPLLSSYLKIPERDKLERAAQQTYGDMAEQWERLGEAKQLAFLRRLGYDVSAAEKKPETYLSWYMIGSQAQEAAVKAMIKGQLR